MTCPQILILKSVSGGTQPKTLVLMVFQKVYVQLAHRWHARILWLYRPALALDGTKSILRPDCWDLVYLAVTLWEVVSK